MSRRTPWVYAGIVAAWLLLVVWQAIEHQRVCAQARAALINRAKDISSTVGLVMRSQRRFGGIISRERLESALAALINPEELNAVALLNAAGEVVAAAGEPIDLDVKGLPTGAHWGTQHVTLLNLVDLGTNVTAVASEPESSHPTLVIPRSELYNPFGTNRSGTNRFPMFPRERDANRETEASGHGNAPQQPPDGAGDGGMSPGGPRDPARPRGTQRRDGGPPNRPAFGRPFWMSEQEFQAAIRKQGVHSFVMMLSTAPVRAAASHDLWLRALITALGAVAAMSFGLAWRGLLRSSELEVRLARAAELNARLKEMNLAAAGLAHETKNPLNIIRGMAQVISKLDQVPEEVRQKTRQIIEETDRVTSQLNDFINYSRPREVRRKIVDLNAVIAEVARALTHDLEEKAVQLEVQQDLPRIEADEALLRQALFNLFLNAIQAVPAQGQIQVAAQRTGPAEAVLEIRDNGPGVPPEHRTEIFKPYFTTHETGTGLGLAVVQQIVFAHGWDIECLPNQPRGAVFRISHLRLAPAA
jgi:signal transduction histidine kinase